MPTDTPPSLPPEDLLARLRWRYATQKFDPGRVIPPETWRALEESLVLAPSSFGLQPWKFFVVQNPDLRRQLSSASRHQPQVTTASHFVVFAIRKKMSPADVDRHLRRVGNVRGVPLESLERYRKVMTGFLARPAETFNVDFWATRQVYIALGFFLAAAALVGVDACPMEGLDPSAYDEILDLDARGYATVVAAAAGYRAADDKYAAIPKVRFPKDEVVETFP